MHTASHLEIYLNDPFRHYPPHSFNRQKEYKLLYDELYFFIDESGDHGLTKVDSDFPVFLLCGVLIKEEDYETVRHSINTIKHAIWGNKEVIFHSRDIRKCEKEFQKLFDLELKAKFYGELNKIIAGSPYTIIASAIQKNRFIEQFLGV